MASVGRRRRAVLLTSNGAVIEILRRAGVREPRRLSPDEGKTPVALTLHQGEAIHRPSRLGLRVDEAGAIFVTGSVIELGRGTIEL